MRIDLNAVAQTFDPWDCTIAFDGIDYPVRPLTVADSQRFDAINKGKIPDTDLRPLVESFFAGEQKPPFDDWFTDGDRLATVLSAIFAYKQELVKKNAERVAQQVAKQMEPNKRS